MPRRLLVTSLAVVPFATACAFLIDFDELQKGNQTAAKDGGTGGSSSSAGGGGGAGQEASTGTTGGTAGTGGSLPSDASTNDATDASGCASSCDDRDPCTVDACSAGACTHTHTAGIVPDGLSTKLSAKTFYRATLAAHKDTFYLSALRTAALSGTDVVLHTFGARDALLSAGKNLTSIAAFGGKNPRSAAGIAAGDSDLFIKFSVAMGGTIGQAAQVWEVTTDASLTVQGAAPAAADSNYLGAATTYPIAWSPSGAEVYSAWPGAAGGVFVHRAGDAPLATGAPPALGGTAQITSLAPLGAGSIPAVFYIGAGPYVQAVGQANPFPLGGCDARPGTYTDAFSAFTKIQDLWIGGWTKTLTAGGTVSETKPIVCGSSSSGVACLGSPRCDSGDQTLPGVRDPAILFVTNTGDPAGRVYQIVAAPYVDPAKNQMGLDLDMVQIDFNLSQPDGGEKTTHITPTPIPLSTVMGGASAAGPDWPAMAFMDPDRLAIAWIEPDASVIGQDALHVERHRICFPKK